MFEQFYQGLLKDMLNIPEENLSIFKAKFHSTCEKYTRIKVPYEYQQTVKGLSKNQNIVIMKQDKGRGVEIMDKLKYHEKCLMIIENDNFKTLRHETTKKTEKKQNAYYRK